ncbi:TRAP transporter substrate-binding protein DctP [Janibacter sp. GS2]|uniref:TRAP transporter substrate-binding protein DctP n=1 Tax=Janibacter sp. GS2 TaxID=3442646 RepID=UPI003EBFD496
MAIASILTPLAACGSGTGGGADGDHDPVKLSFVTAFPKDHALNDGFFMFTKALEEKAPWIEVEYRGGPETMEPNVMIEGVTSGAVDGAHLPGDYYVEQVPSLEIARFTPYTPSQEREEGVSDLWGQIHDDAGLHYVGHSISGIPQVLLLKDEVNEPNLKGKSVRVSSATSNMVKSLGGTPVDLPGGEIYTALERGVIDGAAWTSVGAVDLGIDELVSYDMSPRFYESLANTVINKDTWDSLDQETQDVISETMEESEPKIFDYFSEMSTKETQQWRDAGVEELKFEGKDAQKILDIAYRDAWGELDWDRISSKGPEAQEIRDSFEGAYGDDLTKSVPGGAAAPTK